MKTLLASGLLLIGRGLHHHIKMSGIQPGQQFEDWLFEQEIGSGGFGVVTAWKNQRNHERLVIKQCKQKLDQKNQGRWKEEIHLMNSNNHKNLVAGRAIPTEIENALRSPEPLLGLEYCESDLRKVLGNATHSCGLQENMVLNILRDVSCGLEFLHNKNIVHRDLKPENILLCHKGSDVIYKITDLGYAKQLDARSICMSFVGTIQYLAPELYEYESGYNRTADYWSFGTVIFECITGTRPFLLTDHAFQWPKLIKDKSDQDIWGYNDELSNCVKFCSVIPSPNHMCQPLLNVFNDWLQTVLRHNPKSRGKNEQGEIICYTKINSILQMKIIHVFDILSCTDVAYECQPDDCGCHLKSFLQEKLDIPIEQQLIIFSCGDELDDEDSLVRCCQQRDVIYLFNKQKRLKYTIKTIMPQRVRELCGSPEELRKYADLKMYWSHSLYYCNKIASDYVGLLRGQRALMINTVCSKHKKCNDLKDELVKSAIKLDSVVNIYEKSYLCDLQFYKQTDCTEEEENCLQEWKVMHAEVKSFVECIDTTTILKEVSERQDKCMQLQQSRLISEQMGKNELDDLAQQAEEKVERLRRKAKEKDKKHDSKHIYNIVMKCVDEKERLFKQFYEHLKKVTSIREDLNALIEKLLNQSDDLKEKAEITLKRQLYRQGSLWRLFGSQLPSPVHSMTPVNSFIPSMNNILGVVEKSDSAHIIDNLEDSFQRLENLIKKEEDEMVNEVLPPSPEMKLIPFKWPTVDGVSDLKTSMDVAKYEPHRRESAPPSLQRDEHFLGHRERLTREMPTGQSLLVERIPPLPSFRHSPVTAIPYGVPLYPNQMSSGSPTTSAYGDHQNRISTTPLTTIASQRHSGVNKAPFETQPVHSPGHAYRAYEQAFNNGRYAELSSYQNVRYANASHPPRSGRVQRQDHVEQHNGEMWKAQSMSTSPVNTLRVFQPVTVIKPYSHTGNISSPMRADLSNGFFEPAPCHLSSSPRSLNAHLSYGGTQYGDFTRAVQMPVTTHQTQSNFVQETLVQHGNPNFFASGRRPHIASTSFGEDRVNVRKSNQN